MRNKQKGCGFPRNRMVGFNWSNFTEGMGVSVSTSLSKLKENPILLKFVDNSPILDSDDFWNELLSFSYTPPKSMAEAKLLEETGRPLIDTLVKHNPHSGNLRTLVKRCLELATNLRDESQCESNVVTWRVHNALLIIRLTLKYVLENQSEEEAILQLDGSATIPQITSLEEKTRAMTLGSEGRESSVSDQTRGISLSNGSRGSSSATSPFTQVSGSTLMSLAGKTAGTSADVGQKGGGGGGGEGEEIIKRGGGGVRGGSINPAEVAAMKVLLSRQLVEGLVCLLAEVPLLPFTYDVHLEGINLFLVLLCPQMYPHSSSGILLKHIMAINSEVASLLMHNLLQHFISQPPLPPQDVRAQSSGILSSITSGLWSLVAPTRNPGEVGSPLADHSLLLILVLIHQQTKAHNPFRTALYAFSDEHGGKAPSSFSISLEKLYLTICQQLVNEQTTLFLYVLLQGNANFSSFVFSRSDIHQLVMPLLHLLYDCGSHSSHHVYMLLIILLILSQDDCFNKSIHESVVSKVAWYTERTVVSMPLGSLMAMVLVRTIQVNISQVRDKYLHTNCLAALANMSAHFHSLHLDAAQKIVNLFKLLAKKHQKISERLNSLPSTPTSSSPTDGAPDFATDRSILEEILQMVLEIINSCLTHNLHNNPHLVYTLLYQREVFEPYRTHPSLMDLIQNIETVIAFFSTKLEKSGPSPYSSGFVLETIIQASKSWPRNRLRVFPELRFRYVEEDQPEEFFIPYVWTLVFQSLGLHWDNSKIQFSTT